jgi:glycosyltransferase involved in cell wall biosynthesis
MTVVLYRSRLSLTSGAGQLIRMQAEGLRAAGEDVQVACRRGALRFRLRTRLPVSKVTADSPESISSARTTLLVDHQLEFPTADLVFVHNLVTEAIRHLRRDDWISQAAGEAEFFQALGPEAPIVANSGLVKRALVERFAMDPRRIRILYPGFRPGRFVPQPASPVGDAEDIATLSAPAGRSGREAALMRSNTRRSLGVAVGVPLIGFVTSGDFEKRGLDIFLAAAERIVEARPDVNFLVVGAKRLPFDISRHPLVTRGRLKYRPKSFRPERWFSALDIFLFPARFEEFGMVVSEAQAAGLPVLTSRRVGAAECLPKIYDAWLLDAPDPDGFAERTLALLGDDKARLELAAAGVAGIAAFDRKQYVRASVELIRECARLKASRAVTAKNDSSGTR